MHLQFEGPIAERGRNRDVNPVGSILKRITAIP
jgi:hypothetical protein